MVQFTKRADRDKPSVIRATPEEDTNGTLRNTKLTGIRLDCYLFVQNNPRCTRKDVSKGLSMSASTATARIKELIDEGLLIEPHGDTKLNSSGVRARTLVVNPTGVAKTPRDKVRVEITLYVDENGYYSCESRVVGNDTHSATLKRVAVEKKTITIAAPSPDAYVDEFSNDQEVTPISRVNTIVNDDLIIDAEFTIVDE